MYFDPRLWQFTRGVRGRIAFSVLIGILSSVLGIARLGLLGWLLGLIFQGAPSQEIWRLSAVTAIIILARGGLEYWRAMIAHRTAAMVQLHLRKTLYDKVVELGPAYFGHKRTGDVLVTMIDGVEHLEVYFGQYMPQFFVAALTPLLIFAGVVWLDIWVAAVFLAAALITLIAPSAFHHWDTKNSLARAKAYANFASEFLDSLQGLATLKAFGQSGPRAKVLAQKAHELFRKTMWVLATNALSRGITDTGIAVGAAAAVALGAYRVGEGSLSLTALLVILMLGIEVFRPLRDLRSFLHDGMLAQSAAGKIFSLLGDQSPIPAARNDIDNGALPATIAFKDVSFAYPGGRGATHQSLSFDVASGERIGIVGPSGCGKSSIVRLLLRLYDPQRGKVSLGGQDLKDLSFGQIRSQLAVVNQDTFLFHGTVEDNLRLGKMNASPEELVEAARAANAHDFISALPDGYQTVIGERGVKLSGGQRQRIAIARALLRDAPILVLDEALSAVDAENEAIIQQALDRLMVGRTTLILAHRLSSIIGADRILVIGEGRIVESGDHANLMALGGAYHRLMAEQAAERGQTGAASPPGLLPLDAVSDPAAHSFKTKTSKAVAESDILSAQEDQEKPLGWPKAIRILLGYVMPWKGRLTATFILGVSRVIAFIGVGLLSALAVAAVKENGELWGFAVTDFIWAIMILAPLAGVLHWLESWVAHDMAFRLLAEMRIALFRKLDALAPAYLVRRRSGDMVALATGDVDAVEFFFAHTVAPAFVAVLIPAAALFALAAVNNWLALALFPFLTVVAASPFMLRRRVDRLAAKDREALGELNAYSVDSLQGLQEVVAFQQEDSRRDGLVTLIKKHQAARLPFFGDLTLQQVMVEVMTTMGGLAVIMMGAYLSAAGAIEALYLPCLTLFAMSAFLPVSEIADIGRQLANTLGATRRLNALHSEPVPVTDGPYKAEAGEKENRQPIGVTFEDVTFSYPNQADPAIRQLSLDIPAGRTLALVGPSGAGKTTLAHLLLRFWDPQQGEIDLDDHALTDYRLDALRQQVALVAQDTYLFNDSLEANIRLARPDASDHELAMAIEQAALTDFVTRLPEGLQTRVGERGMSLSGGQRQRVSIARAFLRDAPVLVLDEATSHLDAESERLVHRALKDLMQGRTTIVIAHRLSTVREADKIAVLDEGRLREEGTHGDLVGQGGLYAQLIARQLAAGTEKSAAE
ncbi:MAG: ABC transporter ATP-binding protein [Pseudomonadota bacterium]